MHVTDKMAAVASWTHFWVMVMLTKIKYIAMIF